MAQMKFSESATRSASHVDLGGSALLFNASGDPVGEYRVRDLTSRGALLRGRPWTEDTGRRVHVMLALPSRTEPLEVWGHVGRRVEEATDAVELELHFRDLSADDEDAIEEAILLEWSRVRDA